MSLPTDILNRRLQIEQEVARLEGQIATQTQKLATARRNNVKQIQRSITSRQEKVETLKVELAQICESISATTQTEQKGPNSSRLSPHLTAKSRQGSPPSELSDLDAASGEEHVSDVDITSPSKGMRLTKEPMSQVSKDSVEDCTGDSVLVNSHMDGGPEVQMPSSQNHPLAKERIEDFTEDSVLVNSKTDAGPEVPMPSSQTCPLASPIVQSEDVGCSLDRRGSSSLLMEIGEQVGEILDSAIGRRPPSPSLPAKGFNIHSGTGLSEGTRNLMIGWKYTQYWRNNGSTDSHSGASPTVLDQSTVAGEAARAHAVEALSPQPMDLAPEARVVFPSSPHPTSEAQHDESFPLTFTSVNGEIDSSHIAIKSDSSAQGGANKTDAKTELQESKEGDSALSLLPHSSSSEVPLENPALGIVASAIMQNAPTTMSHAVVHDPLTSSSSAANSGAGMLKPQENSQSGDPIFSMDLALPHRSRSEETSQSPFTSLSTPNPLSQSHGEEVLYLPQAPEPLTNILSSTGGVSHKLRELMKSAAKMGVTLIDFNGEKQDLAPEVAKDSEEVSEVKSGPLAPTEEQVGQSDLKQEPTSAESAPKMKRKRGKSFVHNITSSFS
ncbi:hypothetical protein GYMLUDRAFT_65211 [Collybiopsis luxurians FD-317 M1]|uniref:Uncharacterized protein n=1 Tax=Collybiopsis luxurians FD-317 M1 TaxID=944289 RepID=A0A0D0B8U1_9AGAR|nr:hypothetical protein GYMLUDRAFT_65211 [Collybiopsis luxurians FD-317 M1]